MKGLCKILAIVSVATTIPTIALALDRIQGGVIENSSQVSAADDAASSDSDVKALEEAIQRVNELIVSVDADGSNYPDLNNGGTAGMTDDDDDTLSCSEAGGNRGPHFRGWVLFIPIYTFECRCDDGYRLSERRRRNGETCASHPVQSD